MNGAVFALVTVSAERLEARRAARLKGHLRPNQDHMNAHLRHLMAPKQDPETLCTTSRNRLKELPKRRARIIAHIFQLTFWEKSPKTLTTFIFSGDHFGKAIGRIRSTGVGRAWSGMETPAGSAVR
jgi:hypothetical protein